MPWYTPQETQTDPFGFAEAASPSEAIRWRARGAAATEGLAGTSVALAGRGLERAAAQTGPRMTKEEALKAAAAQGVTLKAGVNEDGIYQGELDLLIGWQQQKQERERLIQAGSLGGVDRFVSTMTGGLLDPINALPFGAGVLAKGEGIGVAIARGAAEGAGVTALAEPLYYSGSRYTGEDYGMLDSVTNIALGGVIGAGMHGAGHVVGSFFERRSAAPLALTQVLEDRLVDVSPVTEPHILRESGRDLTRFGALSIETGEDIARKLATAPETPTARDRAILEGLVSKAVSETPEAERLANMEALSGTMPEELRVRPEEDRVRAAADHMSDTPGKALVGSEGFAELTKARAAPLEMAPVAGEPHPMVAEAQKQMTEAVSAFKDDPAMAQSFEAADEAIKETGRYVKALKAATLCARTKGGPA